MGTRQDPQEERDLAEGLRRGAEGAVARFLNRTHHPVYRMACRLTSDDDIRRDWTHDALLGVLEDLQKGRFVYTRPGSFWAWFRKRAYYRLLDCLRRERLHQARESADGGSVDGPDPGTDHDVTDELARVEVRAAFERCLEALGNEQHRRALVHLLDHQLSYDEIANHMGAPLNTVRAWIRRGRLSLRRCLAERLELPLPQDDA